MTSSTINVLLSTFPGLGLPSTVSIPVPSTTPICDLNGHFPESVSRIKSRMILTTNNNKQLFSTCDAPISSLLSHPTDTILPLRLSIPLCGGKGGFGSQLRAAGGRMSSRKKRRDGDANGSSRNLQGRRLRTVNEAKRLAEYLAEKPEMDRKEREERRKRLESIVEATEKRMEEIKSGGTKVLLDAQWVEAKEEAERKVREAIQRKAEEDRLAEERGGSSKEPKMTVAPPPPPKKLFWDEFNEDFSDSDEEMSDEDEEVDEDTEDTEDMEATEGITVDKGKDVSKEADVVCGPSAKEVDVSENVSIAS